MVPTVQSLKSGQTDLLNRKSRKEVSKRKNQLQQITTSPPFSLPHPARNKMVSGRIDRSLARPIQSSVIVAPHRLNLVLDRTILRHDSLHNPSSSSSLFHHQTMIASRGRELGHVPKSFNATAPSWNFSVEDDRFDSGNRRRSRKSTCRLGFDLILR